MGVFKRLKQDKRFQNYFWNIIGVSLNSFSIMIYLIIITRINGIDNTGMFSFVFAFCAIIQVIALFGGRIYQVSDVNKEFKVNNYFSSKIYSILLSLLFTAIYIIFSNYSVEKIVLLCFILIVKIIETFSDVIYGVFQSNNRLDIVGKSYLLKNILCLIFFYIINIFTRSLLFSSFSLIIINIIIYFFYDFKKVKEYCNISFKKDKKNYLVLKNSFFYFLSSFILLVISNVSRFSVDGFLSNLDQGYFGILIMIPSIITLFGQFIIAPVIIDLSNLYNIKNKKGLIKKILNCIYISIIICAICFLLAYFLGEPILTMLYKVSFKDYKHTFLLLILAGFFNVITLIFSTVLTIIRKTKIQVVLYLITLLISIVSSIYFTQNFQLNGAIISYFLVALIQSLLFVFFSYYVFKKKEDLK